MTASTNRKYTLAARDLGTDSYELKVTGQDDAGNTVKRRVRVRGRRPQALQRQPHPRMEPRLRTGHPARLLRRRRHGQHQHGGHRPRLPGRRLAHRRQRQRHLARHTHRRRRRLRLLGPDHRLRVHQDPHPGDRHLLNPPHRRRHRGMEPPRRRRRGGRERRARPRPRRARPTTTSATSSGRSPTPSTPPRTSGSKSIPDQGDEDEIFNGKGYWVWSTAAGTLVP